MTWTKENEDVAVLFRRIVDMESVSGNETQLADWVEARLRASAHLRVVRQGNCLVARTLTGKDQRVVIAGHLDTVPIANNLPSRIEVRDGVEVLQGRGTVDMKGGVAVQLDLAQRLADPIRDITWVFYDNEEVEAAKNGLGLLARSHPDLLQADLAILMEPTDCVVEGGCQGSLRVTLTTNGVAAHSARSWLGHNAIHDMGPALVALGNYASREIDVDGLTYHEGLNAVHVSGGIAGNVIPDRATMDINYRFAPDKSPDDAMAEVERVFPGYAMEISDIAPGARPGLDTPVTASFVAAMEAPVRAKYGWTDVARFAALGIPAVNFGPGDPNLAHTDDEHCPIGDVVSCRDRLGAWLND